MAWISWIVLIFSLFFLNFGLNWCVIITISGCTFIIGFISLLFIQQGNIDTFYRKCAGNPLTDESISTGGLSTPVDFLLHPKKTQKVDTRVTGSDLIDSSLQEILSFVIRDYVYNWYSIVSADNDFPEKTVKTTIQNFAINLSNRIKNVDWIPYLTTNLVDDAASHLRLFKQARSKLNPVDKTRTPKNSPRKDAKLSPKKSHKRNKSETDITKYFSSKRETEKNVGNSKFYSVTQSKKAPTFEDYFFDLECTMEKNFLCRDLVCIDSNKEKEFLAELVELILFILLPEEDFECKPLRFLVREIFSNCVVLPVFTLISDPDFINQAIMWLCLRDTPLPSEIFLTTLRISDNPDELKYTKELLMKEIQQLRSRDSGGECDLSIKQQLSSLYYVQKLIDNRLLKINNGECPIQLVDYNIPLENIKRVDLPLEVILKNNVALSYFIDYASSQSKQSYLFFYLNIEGWKVSVEQQLSDIHLNKMKGITVNSTLIYDNIRSTAVSIYDQYLGERKELSVELDPRLVHKLFFKLKNHNEPPTEMWFDEIQRAIYDVMQTHNDFLPSFKKSTSYLKLLEELDLLQCHITEEDTVSLGSLENLALESSAPQNTTTTTTSNTSTPTFTLPLSSSNDNLQLLLATNTEPTINTTTNTNYLQVQTSSNHSNDSNSSTTTSELRHVHVKHARSLSDVTDFTTKPTSDGLVTSNGNLNGGAKVAPLVTSEFPDATDVASNVVSAAADVALRVGDFALAVNIIETGIVCERGKTFGIYATHVSRQYDTGLLEEWHIYRRYSDFYDLYSKVKEKYQDLSKLTFPGKKTFHNMDRAVLEKRMRMLGAYLHSLCQSNVINSHIGLRDLLMVFLEQGEYDRATSGGPISNTIDTLVNPIKSGMRTIKNMPEQIFNTVDEVVEGINKVFHAKPGGLKSQEGLKVGAALDIESDDNIPLRIILLLMDEIFDLKSRNQWLRRRIITLLRQIVRTMFGDIVNRRILHYVSLMTSPKNVAYYLQTFKQTFWPNGVKAEPKPERDEGVKSRTRVAAKIALLSCLSDELKHIIGSETTRKGLLTIFELFQRPILNRRLLYVLLEGVLCTLFRDKDMTQIFKKLYSKSPRYQEKQRDSQQR